MVLWTFDYHYYVIYYYYILMSWGARQLIEHVPCLARAAVVVSNKLGQMCANWC